MESVEDDKVSVIVQGLDADAIILHGESDHAILSLGSDANFRRHTLDVSGDRCVRLPVLRRPRRGAAQQYIISAVEKHYVDFRPPTSSDTFETDQAPARGRAVLLDDERDIRTGR